VNIASNIYNFSDYRDFLKDRYRQLKEADPVFSFRFFSKQAGFGSPNYLKLVMDGKRNLSADAIGKFAKGLRLDNHESEFFRYMVECNQCENPARKKVYEAKLMYLRELFKVKTLIPELYDYYHEWYHSAIHEMAKKGPVKNDPTWLSQALVPNITAEEAQGSVELLTKLKFVTIGNDGMLKAIENSAVDAKTAELGQKIHHEQMAELAAQSLYTQGPETQDFGSVTVSLPSEKVEELRAKLHELIMAVTAENTNSPADAVFQLNIQLFALTKAVAAMKQDTAKPGIDKVA
jgi:uncharacterized protein (TIGR02147 family)